MSIRATGSTGNKATIRIVDLATSLPAAGLTLNTSDISLSYKPEGGTAVPIVLNAFNWRDIGDGSYEINIPDVAYAVDRPRLTIEGSLSGYFIVSDIQQVTSLLIPIGGGDGMGVHVVRTGFVNVDAMGNILRKDDPNISIKQQMSTESQHRVLEDPSIPNSVGYPTIKRYLELEAADLYALRHIDQTTIITYPV